MVLITNRSITTTKMITINRVLSARPMRRLLIVFVIMHFLFVMGCMVGPSRSSPNVVDDIRVVLV